MVRIKKEEKPVIAYTSNYIIKGKVFTPPGARLSDYISGVGQKQFIPVSEVVVTDLSGREVCRTGFLELNKDDIIFIFPKSERKIK
jgi:hypothetical protein